MVTQLPHLKEHSSAPPHFSAFALARTPISATAKLLLHSSWQRDATIFNGRPFSRLKLPIAPSHGEWGCGPPSNIWFFGPIGAQNPNGTSIGSVVFAGLTTVTDRQTDKPRSVTTGRIYVRSTATTANHVLDGGSRSLMGRGNFKGKGTARCKV